MLQAASGEALAEPDSFGRRPLALAAGAGHLGCVRLLLERGAARCSVVGSSPAEAAEAEGERQRRSSVSMVEGGNALHAACAAGHADIVGALLERGSPALVAQTDEDGRSPLLLACKAGHLEIAMSLLALPTGVASINRRDRRGASPLLLAVAHGHEPLVDALVAVESLRIDLPDRFGCSPLCVAAAAGSPMVPTLLRAKADPRHADTAGETPLMAAAMHGHPATVGLLLEGAAGACVNAASADGETALMLAIAEHHEGIGRALLVHGASVDAVDGFGRSALLRAVAQAYEEPTRRRSLAYYLQVRPPLFAPSPPLRLSSGDASDCF